MVLQSSGAAGAPRHKITWSPTDNGLRQLWQVQNAVGGEWKTLTTADNIKGGTTVSTSSSASFCDKHKHQNGGGGRTSYDPASGVIEFTGGPLDGQAALVKGHRVNIYNEKRTRTVIDCDTK